MKAQVNSFLLFTKIYYVSMVIIFDMERLSGKIVISRNYNATMNIIYTTAYMYIIYTISGNALKDEIRFGKCLCINI